MCPPHRSTRLPTLAPQALASLAQRLVAVHAQPAPQRSPTAAYALLRLQRAVVSPLPAAAASRLPPAVNLFNGGSAALDKLAPGSAALAKLDSQLRTMGSSLFVSGEPALDSPEFAAAVADLAQSEILRLQASLTRNAQQVRCSVVGSVLGWHLVGTSGWAPWQTGSNADRVAAAPNCPSCVLCWAS